MKLKEIIELIKATNNRVEQIRLEKGELERNHAEELKDMDNRLNLESARLQAAIEMAEIKAKETK